MNDMRLHDTDIEIEFEGQEPIKTTANSLRDVADAIKGGGRQIRMDGEGFGAIRTNFEEARIDEKFRGHGKQVIKSVEMTELAEAVIEDRGLDIGPAAVGCLLIYPNISKKRASKVICCNDVLRHFSGFDYLIHVSGELWDMLDRDSRKMLLLHNLMQVDPVFKAKSQTWKMKLRRPDYRSFYKINDKEGSDWHKVIQATTSSLYDLDPVNETQVKV